MLQEVPVDLKARADVEGEASLRGHLKAEGAERARSPTCRRTKRMTERSRKRSIFFAALSQTRPSRRIRKVLFAKRVAVPRRPIGALALRTPLDNMHSA